MIKFLENFSLTIHKLEKKTQTGFVKLTREWSWLMIGKFIGAAIALLLASVYAHYLTQEEYGTYKYILSIFGIITIFSLQGMEDASQRAVANERDGAFWQTLRIRLKFGTLTAAVSLIIGVYYLFNGNGVLGWIFVGAAPFVAILDIIPHYNTLLLGRQLFKQISLNNTVIQILTSAMIIAAVMLTQNIFWLVAAFVFSGIFFGLFGFWHTLRINKLNTTPDPSAINFGKHMSALGIVSIATNQATPFLLWHFLGAKELAIYSFALAAVSQFRGIFKVLTTTMAFPKLSKIEKLNLKQTLPKKVLYAHFVTIPSAILLTLIIAPTYNILFPTYHESIIYAQAMTLLLAFIPMRLYSTALMAHAKPAAIHTMSVVNTVTLLGGLAIFIPLFGIWGVVIANAVSQLVNNSVVVYLFRRM